MNGADAYRLALRIRARLFTLTICRSFAAWGPNSVALPPLRLGGERRITVGARVLFGAGCWLNAIGGVITVGDGCSFSGDCTISAAESVTLGREVLVARGVHIADHDHAFEDAGRPVMRQGITDPTPVTVGDGAWIGHGASVLAGVSIGEGAVIGAGAVVTRDVPPYSLAVGAPARVIRSWAPTDRAPSTSAAGLLAPEPGPPSHSRRSPGPPLARPERPKSSQSDYGLPGTE